MDRLINKYNALPEWVRWILFLPVTLIVSVVFGFLLYIILRYLLHPTYSFFLWEGFLKTINADRILYSVTVSAVFLIALFFTIPRWKIGTLVFFVAIRSLLFLLLLFPIVATPYFVSIGLVGESAFKDV